MKVVYVEFKEHVIINSEKSVNPATNKVKK